MAERFACREKLERQMISDTLSVGCGSTELEQSCAACG